MGRRHIDLAGLARVGERHAEHVLLGGPDLGFGLDVPRERVDPRLIDLAFAKGGTRLVLSFVVGHVRHDSDALHSVKRHLDTRREAMHRHTTGSRAGRR
jgi:hypothetical protein